MKVKKIILFITLIFTIFLVGCSDRNNDKVFYIVSDEWGSVVVYNRGERYILIASITLQDLLTFRRTLLNNSITSDNCGALHYLFSLDYDYLIEGKKEDWVNLYQKEQLSHSERVNYIINDSDDLSKIINIDTLKSLMGNNTRIDDVVKIHNHLKRDDYLLRVYRVSQFFDSRGDISLNRRNMKEWLNRALEEIRSK